MNKEWKEIFLLSKVTFNEIFEDLRQFLDQKVLFTFTQPYNYPRQFFSLVNGQRIQKHFICVNRKLWLQCKHSLRNMNTFQTDNEVSQFCNFYRLFHKVIIKRFFRVPSRSRNTPRNLKWFENALLIPFSYFCVSPTFSPVPVTCWKSDREFLEGNKIPLIDGTSLQICLSIWFEKH